MKYIRFRRLYVKKFLMVGTPIALQELLVQFSFLFIQVVVNNMGVTESAAVGVAEKVCIFLMLVASAYMQSISAFVAQNYGAGTFVRARKALCYGISKALVAGIITGLIAYFGGSWRCYIFSSETQVVSCAHDYLKAYAIDCVLTAILFCFVGYFNGCGKTMFVMIQGVFGAFCVRIPVVFLMGQIDNASLFHIGLGSPISSATQIILCVIVYCIYQSKLNKKIKKQSHWNRYVIQPMIQKADSGYFCIGFFSLVCNKGNRLQCRWERKNISEDRSDRIKTP